MFRVHQFDNEMFVFREPTARRGHESLLALEEELCSSVSCTAAVNIAAGDLGAQAAKKTTSRRGSGPKALPRDHRPRTRPTIRRAGSASPARQPSRPR
jgi:hypothetical protein